MVDGDIIKIGAKQLFMAVSMPRVKNPASGARRPKKNTGPRIRRIITTFFHSRLFMKSNVIKGTSTGSGRSFTLDVHKSFSAK